MLLKNSIYPHSQNSVRKRYESVYFILAISCSLICFCNAGTENLTKPNVAASSSTASYQNAGTRTVLRVYDECTHSEVGFVPCLKKKAISFIDRISNIDAITVAEGIRLVRLPGTEKGLPQLHRLSENELESSSSSRSGEDRDVKLTNMLTERLSHFFNGHTLQINFPKLSSDEIGRGLEEGNEWEDPQTMLVLLRRNFSLYPI